MEKEKYILDDDEDERTEYELKKLEEKEREEREREEREQGKKEQTLGDVYDVYQKAVSVQSKLSGMTEDYTLTRYDIDIYNQKFPKFIREQRKILRIIKSYLIIPLNILKKHYNTEERAKEAHTRLIKEQNNKLDKRVNLIEEIGEELNLKPYGKDYPRINEYNYKENIKGLTLEVDYSGEELSVEMRLKGDQIKRFIEFLKVVEE